MKHLEWRKYREGNSKRLECHAIFARITVILGHEMIPGIDILDVNLRRKQRRGLNFTRYLRQSTIENKLLRSNKRYDTMRINGNNYMGIRAFPGG